MKNSTSQIEKKIDIQKGYIRELILKASVGMIGLLAFSLMAVSVTFKNVNGYWIPDVVCAGLEICVLILLWLFSKRLLRARNFYLLSINIYIPGLFGIAYDIIRIVALATNFSITLVILIILISLIMGCVFQISVIKKKLNREKALNIASGRLNENTGEWDLTYKLKSDIPTAKKSKPSLKNTMGWLVYFAPAIGIALNRNLEEPEKFLVFGICLYFFVAIIIWVIGNNIAIFLYLLEWERATGKKMMVITKNPYD
jgi:hypothetical protein